MSDLVRVCLALLWLGGLASAQTEVCAPDAVEIVSTEVVTSSVEVTDEMQVDDVRVGIEITHGWMGDLVIALESPGGSEVTLKTADLFDDDSEDMLLTFADSGGDYAVDAWTCDCEMAPAGPLSAFDGENSLGDWVLSITDVSAPDEGTLEEWCLEVTGCGVVIPVELTCEVVGSEVTLAWTGTGFETYSVTRNGALVATVLDTEEFEFSEILDPGSYLYGVGGFDEDDGCSSGRPCTIDISAIDSCITVGSDIDSELDAVESVMDPGNVVTLVEELGVSVDISHAAVGDLSVELENPEGVSVTLHDGAGDELTDLIVLYSDNAPANGFTEFNCGCHMRAAGPGELADLLVDPEGGDWALTVTDNVNNGSNGTLNGWCLRFYGEPADDDAVEFVRADCDNNGTVFPIIDALYALDFGFNMGPTPGCLAACDADGNGTLFPILDALYALEYGFTDGPEPPGPFPDCGPDSNDPGPGCQDPVCP